MTDTASNPHVYLPGLALAGYRSFGPNIQFMGPFSQINVFAGPNNVGKSNILRFISEWMSKNFFVRGAPKQGLHPVDDISRFPSTGLIIGFPLPSDRDAIREFFPNWSQQQVDTAIWLLQKPVAPQGLQQAWWTKLYSTDLRFSNKHNNLILPEFADCMNEIRLEAIHPWRAGDRLWVREERMYKADDLSTLITLCFDDLLFMIKDIPQVRYVPADRRIRSDGGGQNVSIETYKGSGDSLIELYAKLQQPDETEYIAALEARGAIHRFLADVTGESDIEISVPHHRQYFTVIRKGISERLNVLGTGMYHLIIMAVEATLRREEIICLEEPEVFLHPILQRKLIEYLKTTSNQYFISTHSAQFLDVPEVAVFHLEMTDDGTKVSKAETSSHRFAVCRDLGYRASDIVQANCIVWVEGPSELFYLRKWITEIDPTLRHGIEYSVMFYGGSLSSWLTGDAPEDTKELISLVTINRHSAFVMDSDKESEADELKAEKVTVEKSVEAAGGFTWVTQGREIENYVPFSQMQACVKRLRRATAPPLADNGLYGFAYPKNAKNEAIIAKTKLANVICDEPVQWGDTDLKDRVSELVNYIREANRLARLESPPAG